tara:strand:- start:53 stop:328 length:276 start_codon:yes stop_codon:yes gene_type:complete
MKEENYRNFQEGDFNKGDKVVLRFPSQRDLLQRLSEGDVLTVDEDRSLYPWCITRTGNRVSVGQSRLKLLSKMDYSPDGFTTTVTEPYKIV